MWPFGLSTKQRFADLEAFEKEVISAYIKKHGGDDNPGGPAWSAGLLAVIQVRHTAVDWCGVPDPKVYRQWPMDDLTGG